MDARTASLNWKIPITHMTTIGPGMTDEEYVVHILADGDAAVVDDTGTVGRCIYPADLYSAHFYELTDHELNVLYSE